MKCTMKPRRKVGLLLPFAIAVVAYAVTPGPGSLRAESASCGQFKGNKCTEVEICGGAGNNKICRTQVISWYREAPERI
jgi:hypothetical protein